MLVIKSQAIRFFLVVFSLYFFLFTSCKKEDNIITDSSAKLEFSFDSVLFDTVFTTIGSTTKQLKVYNRHNKKINITSIYLAKGSSSNFTINIDGSPLLSASNVEIGANDSLFIFVRVTVDPNNQNSPVVINDSIIFITNGNLQDVDLIAWGQDAYYHVPDHYPSNFPPYSIIPCDTTWVFDKPHIIYGYLVVDSACTLTIQEDVKVYMHDKAVLWIYKDGTLKINGQKDHEVVFQGDRLEAWYKDLPGQWGRIWLSAGSKNNEIDYAIIRNGMVGIHIDTLGSSSSPTLKLSNTIIENMSAFGLLAQGSYIEASNCVFTNCGNYSVFLNIGGNYDFKQCTFANYWTYSIRQTPLLRLNNYYEDINGVYQIRDLTKAYFGNCIVYGNNAEEISLDKFTGVQGLFNYEFDHCLLKTSLNTSNASIYKSCIINIDPAFVDYTINNHQLLSGSPAKDAGNPSLGSLIPYDLNNKPRDTYPDIGAYEYVDP